MRTSCVGWPVTRGLNHHLRCTTVHGTTPTSSSGHKLVSSVIFQQADSRGIECRQKSATSSTELEVLETLSINSQLPERANDEWLHLDNKIGQPLKTATLTVEGILGDCERGAERHPEAE